MSARVAYEAARRRARDKAEPREERGLPHHPDGSGWAECAACEGAGSHVVNNTNPYGYGPDPQCDEDVECSRCFGRGQVRDGTPDPLYVMAEARLRWRHTWWHDTPFARMRYGRARQLAMSPVPLPSDRLPEPMRKAA